LFASNIILLLKEPNGEKFKYAQIKGIPCLNIQWFYDSIGKGFALPEEKYCFTLNPDEFNIKNSSNVSISRENEIRSNNLSQEIKTKCNIESNAVMTHNSAQDIIKLIESLTSVQNNEQFLKGCVVYVIGFDQNVIKRIKTVVISYGSEFSAISLSQTYVIIGPNYSHSDFDILSNNKIYKYVSIEWFFDCLRHKQICDYTKYEFKNTKLVKNSKENERIIAQEIIASASKVFQSKSAQKASERLAKISKINKLQANKSLASLSNEEFPIEWDFRNPNISQSQKPYFDNCLQNKEQELSEIPNESKLSKENEVEIIEDQFLENEQIIDLRLSFGEPMDVSLTSISRGFMFSGYDTQTKYKLSEIVTNLNGFVVDSNHIVESVTHLITKTPNITEKILSAIASGIWILKEEFIYDSQSKSAFVSEEQYEWGLYSNQNENIERGSQTCDSVMKSSIDWRKYLLLKKKKGIFENFKVLMFHKTKLTKTYAQVLSCGKAEVVFINENLKISDLSQFEFALIDLKGTDSIPKYSKNFATHLLYDMKLYKIEFLVYYLLNGPNSSNTNQNLLIRDFHLDKIFSEEE
jgi:hypothetical protein